MTRPRTVAIAKALKKYNYQAAKDYLDGAAHREKINKEAREILAGAPASPKEPDADLT